MSNGDHLDPDANGADDDVESIDGLERAIRVAMRDGDTEVEADLRSVAAQFYLDNGDAGRAVEHCQRLIDVYTRSQGRQGERTMVWRGFLGRAYTEARLYDRAEVVLRDLLADRTLGLGPDHPSTLVTRGNLARVIGRSGRPHEALEIADDLLADRLRILGPDHPSTLDSRGHIAQLHDLAGDHVTALRLLRELLADRERLLPPDDPALLSTRHNIAVIAAAVDGTEGGLVELDANVERVTELHGAEHPDALVARAVRAEHLMRLGAFESAADELREVLAARVRVLGEFAPATIVSHRMLLECLLGLGQAAHALPQLRALERAATGVLGDASLDTHAVRRLLVRALMACEEFAEAAQVQATLPPHGPR
ncbi:MAG: tetratricopeptide repeat protein [Ilumatobacteraceae bacterium]